MQHDTLKWPHKPPTGQSWLPVIIALSICPPAAAQTQDTGTPKPQAQVLAELQDTFERIDEFQLSDWTTGPRGTFFVSGNLTLRAQPAAQTADPLAAALQASVALLDVDTNDFTPSETTTFTDAQGVTHRRYVFTFQGWQIEDFELVTHVSAGGTLTAINGNIVRFSPSDVAQLRMTADQPLISADDAAAIVLDDIEGTQDRSPGLQQIISPDPPYFFWTVTVGTRNPLGAWRYYVEATSGTIRNRVDLMVQ